MNLYNCRLFHVLLTLCLVVALVACGDGPTSVPDVATRPPTVAVATVSADEMSDPTSTSEAQEPATPPPAPASSVAPTATATSTATATPMAGPLPAANRCEGLSGQLEIQVLVGPAEAVGLEPIAVGSVPFAVTASGSSYLVEGQGPISYETTLVKEWGTYAVTMDLNMAVQGECSGQADNEQLHLVLEMTGKQLVVVDAGDFYGEYPWSGSRSLDLTFPLEEGATAQGEGWVVVLHLSGS